MTDEAMILLGYNIQKLPKLKKLNIQNNPGKTCVYYLTKFLPKQTALREIAFDYCDQSKYAFDVFDYLYERGLQILIDTGKYEYSAIKISHLFFTKTLILGRLKLQLHDQILFPTFDNIETFALDTAQIDNFSRNRTFFEKLQSITRLKISVFGPGNAELLSLLIQNNPISSIELVNFLIFKKFKKLAEILNSCRLKKIVITNTSDYEIQKHHFMPFFNIPRHSSFWKSVQVLTLNDFHLDCLTEILQSMKMPNLR